jgi:hypothetical protein
MKLLLLVVLSLAILNPLLSPQPALAHGSGPPFLLINGKYAQTNPLFLGIPDFRLTISQDDPPEKYLVNQPIAFEVDKSKLLAPAEIIEQSTFRWSFEKDSTDYETGTRLSHTYDKIGSYLVSIEVKAPESPQYVVINTVQINVVPYLDYQLPSAAIQVVGSDFKSGVPINFVSKVEKDPDSRIDSYLWFFDEENYKTEEKTSFTYNQRDYVHFVFLEVRDKNGFLAHDGVQVNETQGSIVVLSLRNYGTPVAQAQEAAALIRSNVLPYLVGSAGAAVLILIAATLVFRRKKL